MNALVAEWNSVKLVGRNTLMTSMKNTSKSSTTKPDTEEKPVPPYYLGGCY